MTATDRVEQLKDADINKVVERIINVFKPECIYLFGSRARGDFHEDSDYDFMVIVADDFPEEGRSAKAHSEALRGLGIYHDVKIWRRGGFERQLHLKASMPSSVLREGKLLYLRSGEQILSYGDLKSKNWYVREEPSSGYDPVTIEITQLWLQRAKHDIRGAEFYINDSPDESEEALFHCQQCIEKCLKAFLVWHDLPYIKTHGLAELAAQCVQVDSSLEPLLENIDPLSRWSVDGRYVHKHEPGTVEEAEAALRRAREIFEAIIERVPEVVRNLERGEGV